LIHVLQIDANDDDDNDNDDR